MTTLRRRSLLALPALFAPRLARAQALLDRPARIVVGAAPGGGTDIVARLIAPQLTGRYAPQVVVENRPGASSRLAAEAVKAAPADGTTILICPMPVLALFPHTLPRTTRYTLADFTPVSTVGEIAYGFAVPAAHPARDLPGFIDWAKRQGEASFAPPVLGAPQHMLGLAFAQDAGIRFNVITYRAASQATQDLIASRIDCAMSHMAEFAPPARSGQTRLLAVSSVARLQTFPDASTFAEQGFPAITGTEAFCVVLPAGAPAPVVTALHQAVGAAVASAAVRERLGLLEMAPRALTPPETAARLRREYEAWGPIVQASGFRPEE